MSREEHDKLEIGDIIQFKGLDWEVWCIWGDGCSVRRGVCCEPIIVVSTAL